MAEKSGLLSSLQTENLMTLDFAETLVFQYSYDFQKTYWAISHNSAAGGMQLAIAQHATVHFAEEGLAFVHHQEQDKQDHKPHSSKLCQLCLLSKDFKNGLAHVGPDIPVPTLVEFEVFDSTAAIVFNGGLASYTARAPPLFSA